MAEEHKYVDAGDIDLDEEIVYDSNGNRITEAVAEEMAERTMQRLREEGRVGRPSLTGPGKHSPQVAFRLSDHLREKVEARARAEHKSVSRVAREALEKYLAS